MNSRENIVLTKPCQFSWKGGWWKDDLKYLFKYSHFFQGAHFRFPCIHVVPYLDLLGIQIRNRIPRNGNNCVKFFLLEVFIFSLGSALVSRKVKAELDFLVRLCIYVLFYSRALWVINSVPCYASKVNSSSFLDFLRLSCKHVKRGQTITLITAGDVMTGQASWFLPTFHHFSSNQININIWTLYCLPLKSDNFPDA